MQHVKILMMIQLLWHVAVRNRQEQESGGLQGPIELPHLSTEKNLRKLCGILSDLSHAIYQYRLWILPDWILVDTSNS